MGLCERVLLVRLDSHRMNKQVSSFGIFDDYYLIYINFNILKGEIDGE